jgi:hypothetical protein
VKGSRTYGQVEVEPLGEAVIRRVDAAAQREQPDQVPAVTPELTSSPGRYPPAA